MLKDNHSTTISRFRKLSTRKKIILMSLWPMINDHQKSRSQAKQEELPRKVVVVGATSGIGLALAEQYADMGWRVGVAGRRLERLKAFQQKHLGQAFIKQIDVTNPIKACIQLDYLIDHMQGMEVLIICAGTGDIDPELDWSISDRTIETNVQGFTAIANRGFKYFLERKSGQLAAITSIAGLRGGDVSPSYNASKSYQSNYLQGLQKKAVKTNSNIHITDIKAGFVDTAMAKGDGQFWKASPKKAAKQIVSAIHKKRSVAYVTKRWRLIAWLLMLLPGWFFNRL
ncbi:SDR family NAD(P)-dependent oxidoreductase [Aliikangiella marina]|uniref:SDR family NAD(P)-dependent oxidoreductase n=2 Tax=Aliikangiella marina TaxID=1712262 RepID=A0A545T4Z7_9GAMM|nr:SDR family NAD(P)-dependent oxidoreductase [Aliikangiella marina]